MAKLKITREGVEATTYDLTPAIEYAFELHFKDGFHKHFREKEYQSSVYWLAWECIRRSGEVVPEFGMKFIETLVKVEVIDEADPKE